MIEIIVGAIASAVLGGGGLLLGRQMGGGAAPSTGKPALDAALQVLSAANPRLAAAITLAQKLLADEDHNGVADVLERGLRRRKPAAFGPPLPPPGGDTGPTTP
jgi:hypothetical protein